MHHLNRSHLNHPLSLIFAFALASSWVTACGGDDDDGGGTGATGGTSGAAGSGLGGSAGVAGTPAAGSGGTPMAGSGGTPATGGTAGVSGSSGAAGAPEGGEGGEAGAPEGGQGGAPEGGTGGAPEGGADSGGEGGATTATCATGALSVTHVSAQPNQAHQHMPPLQGMARTTFLNMVNSGAPLTFTVPMDGTNPHTHTLTFTAPQLTTLRDGGTVAMITSSTGGPVANQHTHTYSIECAP